MRVAVVGAGAAGSACAWRLLTHKGAEGMSVTMFEMGRGAGGRAGTRHVPGVPGLSVNHGAPLFHVPDSDERTKPLVSALLESGYLAEWRGSYGSVDALTGVSSVGGASRGELKLGSQPFARYSGNPGMSSLARGCLELARQRRAAALETHFGTRVKELRPRKVADAIVGWDIVDKDGKTFGAFDWVVMAGATPALARWREGFKEEPPVYAAAQASGSELFRNLVTHLDRPLPYEQTHVVSLAWDISAGGEAADSVTQCLRQLPFDITQVNGDEALAKVILQNAGPQYATIVLHSTPAFARKHKKVMGSGSYVSVANNVEGSVDAEQAVGEELFRSFRTLLEKMGQSKLPVPAWGPALHRWGAAFPEPDMGPVGSDETWVLPAERFAFAGDYLAPPNACVAAALRSGLAAGDALLKVAKGHEVAPPVLKAVSAL